MRKGAPDQVYADLGLADAALDAQEYYIAARTGWTLEYIRGMTLTDHQGLLGLLDGLNKTDGADG